MAVTRDVTRRRLLLGTTLLSAGVGLAGRQAIADYYPTRPIRLLVPGAAGSVPDVIARLVCARLSTALGQPIVVENRPGPGGIVAMQAMVGSSPDGYTIAITTRSQAVFNTYLFSKLPYDPLHDLEPVSTLVTGANALAAHPAFLANTFGEFVSMAKAQPGKIYLGVPANGSPPHMDALLKVRTAGIEVTFVPFRSGPDALTSLLRGDVQVSIDSPLMFTPHVKDRTLKVLAVTGRTREDALPDVPTVAEAGFPGAQGEGWIGIVAPTRTPREIVLRLNHEIATVLAIDELRGRLQTLSFTPMLATPEEFQALIREEHARWGIVIRKAGLRLD
jgi:tripartite-type tricarboxylate transporter receptor subunit TctC